ncbi:MAG TPA: hypothetical protein VGC47_09950 [Acidimicrobiia bacterium]
MTTSSISVSVPANREALAVLRVVACGAATQADIPYDSAEDAMLATNEMASLMVAADTKARIEAGFTVAAGEVHVEMSIDPRGSGAWPPATWEGSLEQRVLAAVADEVDVSGQGGVLARYRVSG